MSLPVKNGRTGSGSSQRNYKYHRISSAEKGSDNCYISCDEDEDELFTSPAIELKKVGGKSNSSGASKGGVKFMTDYEQILDRPIKTGETLMGIALKYRIPVSELKRVNKIIQEKEFFALKTVKIPIKANSVLVEVLEAEQQQDQEDAADCGAVGGEGAGARSVGSTRAAVLGTRSLSSCSEYESDSELHVGYISINHILRDTRTKKEAKRFLDTMQRDLANIREKTTSYKGSLDEVAAALTDPRFQPLTQTTDQCSGADWGITWWKILLVGTLALVALPLLYIYLYLNNNNNNHNNTSHHLS